MGTVIFTILIGAEIFFLIWTLHSKTGRQQEKSIVRIALFALLCVLLLTKVFTWGLRFFALFTVLLIQAVMGVIVLIRKKEPYNTGKSIRNAVGSVILYTFAVAPVFIFLTYSPPDPTGNYGVATTKYTWVDENRIESFTDTGENRALTVEFWYPEGVDGKVPLVVFSHGAFGFSGSNYSTFTELASHGFVVASIGHTYHAFFTKDTNGKMTLVNIGFLNEVNAVNTQDDWEKDYYNTRSWMDLRVADEHFVLDTIIAKAEKADKSDELFSVIDTSHIGVIGHSLGGASFAQTARERDDIDAVINLDGSMLGEEIGFANGKFILNETPYPVPLLNLYAEDHYRKAMELVGEDYENFYTSRNAICAYEVIIKKAGHLNFTDLPLFSPTLAKILGAGSVDARYCIKKTNEIVLEFFDCYLKNGETPVFEREY